MHPCCNGYRRQKAPRAPARRPPRAPRPPCPQTPGRGGSRAHSAQTTRRARAKLGTGRSDATTDLAHARRRGHAPPYGAQCPKWGPAPAGMAPSGPRRHGAVVQIFLNRITPTMTHECPWKLCLETKGSGVMGDPRQGSGGERR